MARPDQCGATLIELMVGIAIGLLVILAAMSTMLLSRGVSTTVSEVSRLQQQGAYALRVMGVQIRQAGALDPEYDPVTGFYGVPVSTAPSAGPSGAAVSGSDSSKGFSTVTVVSRAAPLGDPSSAGKLYQLDCLGEDFKPDAVNTAAFFGDPDGALRCRGTKNSQPIINDVAAFNVRYRTSTSGGIQFLTAAQVEKAGLWASIRAIEVCMDLQGTETIQDGGGTYVDCADTTKARGNRTHVVLRNLFELRLQGS